MATWNTVDATATSAATPVWVVEDLAAGAATAGTAQWNTIDLAADAAAAGSAAWRVLDLSVQALAAVDRAYVQMQGRDGSLYPAYAYVMSPSGELV